jgi:RNA polymerase sigma-70 factor (ECF subfamily)
MNRGTQPRPEFDLAVHRGRRYPGEGEAVTQGGERGERIVGPSDASATLAFDALVRAEYPRMIAFVRRYVKSPETAEDIAQDVFGAIWRQGARIDYTDPLPYLYRAARNRIQTWLRDARVRDRWQGAITETEYEGAVAAPEPANDAAALSAAIARAVDALPARTREVFLLSRESGLTYTQIATTMGISPKTVEAQMSRAFRMLRQALAPFMEGQ